MFRSDGENNPLVEDTNHQIPKYTTDKQELKYKEE